MKKVCILGGGIIGLCSAYELNRRGFDVTVVERMGRDHLGCSHGNAGMIVPSHFIPLAAPGMIAMGLRMMPNPKSPFAFHMSLKPSLLRWVLQFARSANPKHVEAASPVLRDLSLASRAAFESMTETFGGELGFTKLGLLMLCREQATLDEEAHEAEQANALGLHANVVAGDALAALDPTITMRAAGAIHFVDDCHASPHAFMDLLRDVVLATGVRIVYDCEVNVIRKSASRINAIEAANGSFEADEFVLATGSWSEAIARQLGLRLPVQPGKGYSMTVKNPVQLPQLCSILTEARVAVTPMNGALRFGGTMEIGASEHGVNRNRVQGIIDSIPGFFPAFADQDFSKEPVWSGLRPCSPDGVPYIGRTRAVENLTIATGHAMMGFSLGPITGKLVSEIIAGDAPTISTKLLDPDRFA